MYSRARTFFAILGLLGALALPQAPVFAQEEIVALPPDEYARGRVLSVEEKGVQTDALGEIERVADYRVRLLSGPQKGEDITIAGSVFSAKGGQRPIAVGDRVVLVKSVQIDGSVRWYVADTYRLPTLLWMTLGFFALAVLFGGLRGFTSMLGLGASVFIILGWIVPRILGGGSPFIATLIGTFAIAAVSLYLAHGFNKRTSVAFVGTIITLALSAAFAALAVALARMNGMGDEHALYLQNGDFGAIDLRGLLLGGIMLGVLGVLDDITTAQSAVVDELKRANPSLPFKELYTRGLSVGREHIASLVNTLFLAYAGASLPLFLLFTVYKDQPVWFLLNSEVISEEIVRTLVGSVCLILAVPITTALAAAVFGKTGPDETTDHRGHGHAH